MRKYSTKQAASAQKIETLGGDCALKWDDATQMGVNAHAATEPGGSRPVATEIKAWQNLWSSTYKAVGKKLFYTNNFPGCAMPLATAVP